VAAVLALLGVVAYTNRIERPVAVNVSIGLGEAAWPWNVSEKKSELAGMGLVECDVSYASLNDKASDSISCFYSNSPITGSIWKV
jgi:hypothetical protein